MSASFNFFLNLLFFILFVCGHVLSANFLFYFFLFRKWLLCLLFCSLRPPDHILPITWIQQYRHIETRASMALLLSPLSPFSSSSSPSSSPVAFYTLLCMYLQIPARYQMKNKRLICSLNLIICSLNLIICSLNLITLSPLFS